MDLESYRQTSREKWESAATGWAKRRGQLQRSAMPVSRWLVDAIRPQPGHRVLELAAGPGDTGLLAAELIEPGGTLISSDFAEPMLDAARERARELGVDNAEFRVIDAESIDLAVASLDAVLCRWGYMLMADPATALRETRRVLRPGGRVALAVWTSEDRNPWIAPALRELARVTGAPPPDPDAPGMFALAAPQKLERLLADAGFTEILIEPLDFEQSYGDFEDWWATTLDLSVPLAVAYDELDERQQQDFRRTLALELGRFADDEGRLVFPARTLVASATA